jgi:hypothetical protein
VGELPRKKEKKKAISVNAPDYLPKRKPILKDTTGTEALDVFKMTKNVNRGFSLAMMVIGISIIGLSMYSQLSSINLFLNPLFVGILGFVGAVNIFCGLLLLSKK